MQNKIENIIENGKRNNLFKAEIINQVSRYLSVSAKMSMVSAQHIAKGYVG